MSDGNESWKEGVKKNCLEKLKRNNHFRDQFKKEVVKISSMGKRRDVASVGSLGIFIKQWLSKQIKVQ